VTKKSSQLLDVQVALSVMHPASNELPSEMSQKAIVSPDYETGSGHVGKNFVPARLGTRSLFKIFRLFWNNATVDERSKCLSHHSLSRKAP